MRELTLNLKHDDKPRYLQITAAIRQAIVAGQLQKGEVIPSSRMLAEMLDVHRHTIMAALAELVAEGWITATQRKAYQVNQLLPTKLLEACALPKNKKIYPNFNWSSHVKNSIAPNESNQENIKYNFSVGSDIRLFPLEEFRLSLNESLKLASTDIAGYGDPAGYPSLIAALKNYLRRIRAITDREILITHGSQEGIYLTTQLLLKPGANVAVENLCYQPAVETIKAKGANIIPIKIDDEGIDPDDLAKILKKKRIQLLYLTPLHQFPTTVTLSIARRCQIYDLAAHYQIPILEDDYDHEFHYRSQPLPPLASQDPANLVIYVSTFSKILFPSMRLGFMALPSAIIQQFRGYRKITTRQNDAVMQNAVAHWMNAGDFERHLRRMRRIYEERLNVMESCLKQLREQGLPLAWKSPNGGMALWLNTQQDSVEISAQARKLRVNVVPESKFQITPTKSTHLRLGFANQNPHEIEMGLKLLGKIILSL